MSESAKVVALGISIALVTTLQAEGIMEAHIKAVGGKDAIAEIKTIHRTGTLSGKSSYGPLSGVIEEIFDLSKNRGYTSLELTGYSRKAGWNGDSGWAIDTQAGVTDMQADEASFAQYSAGPSPLATIWAAQGAGALKVGGDKDFNGKTCIVVTVEGVPMEFYVNQETKLLEGMSVPGNLQMTLEDYKAVNGVQFASKTTMKIEAQNMTMVYEYKTTKLNGKVDQTKFKKPSGPTPGKESAVAVEGRVTAKQLISSMDTNGDSKISKNEASEDLKLFFAEIDANGDGRIDVKEAQAMADYVNKEQAESTQPTSAPSRVTAKQLISSMDTNRDGKIDKDEAPQEVKKNFQYIDTNGDGAIDVKEAQVMADYANQQKQ